MNLPNRLTIVRIILIPIFVALFFVEISGFPYLRLAALGVFIVASSTDFLDGYIARKYNLVTTVGNFLDTIADKMLVGCALIAVATDIHEIYLLTIAVAVFAMINICRELFISALKMIASAKGVNISADKLGKVKMALQTLSLICLIPYRDIFALNTFVADIILYTGVGLLALATIMAVIAGINYIVKYRYVFKEEKE